MTYPFLMTLDHVIQAHNNNDELAKKLFKKFNTREALIEFLDTPEPEELKPANGKLEFVLHYAIVCQLERAENAKSDLAYMQEDYMLQQLCEAYVDVFDDLPEDIIQALRG